MRFLITFFVLFSAATGAIAQSAGATTTTTTTAIESLRQLLATRQHQLLEQHIADRAEASLRDLSTYRALRRDLRHLVEIAPASPDPFDAWVADTSSGMAHLARAEFHVSRAWDARASKAARDTHSDNFARMGQLLEVARGDYELALAKLGARCDLCHAGLLQVSLHQKQRQRASEQLDAAMQALGGGIATPRMYLEYLQPRWGGNLSEMERFVGRFAVAYPGAPAIPMLRGAWLLERSRWQAQLGKHEQALVLAEQANQVDPGNAQAWNQTAETAIDLNRIDLALAASAQALAIEPDLVRFLIIRSSALLKSPSPVDAVPYLERAVAMGDEWALQALLPIVAAGKYGFKPDPGRAQVICQSAIDALMPSGYACMGGLNYFGIGRAADKPRAFQLFAEAADRGVTQAMMDAALMLSRGDGVARDPKRAIEYWMMAFKAGDTRAKAQLQAHMSQWEYFRRVELPGYQASIGAKFRENHTQTRVLIGIVVFVVGSLFSGFLYSAADRPARRMGRLRLLRAGWLVRLLAILNLALIGACGWLIRGLIVDEPLMIGAAFALMVTSALYMGYGVFLTKVAFDDTAVYFRSPFAGKRVIRFDDITECDWSWTHQSNYIQSSTGERIYVSQTLEGYGELDERLEQEFAKFNDTQPA